MSVTRLSAARRVSTANIGVLHPEAVNWAQRVATNSGTVSVSTLNAVSQFCYDIDTAGIRDRFYRLNLLCGDQLAAAMVPLFRGASLSGTQFGFTVDQNNGPFVSANYANTGASGGLTKPDGAGTKWINSGILFTALPQLANAHISASLSQNYSVTGGFLMGKGGTFAMNQSTFMQWAYVSPTQVSVGLHDQSNVEATNSTHAYHRWIGTRTAANALTLYRNGLAVGSNGTATTFSTSNLEANNFFHPTTNSNSSLHRLHYYSLGAGLTAAQAASLDAAFAKFLFALNRT